MSRTRIASIFDRPAAAAVPLLLLLAAAMAAGTAGRPDGGPASVAQLLTSDRSPPALARYFRELGLHRVCSSAPMAPHELSSAVASAAAARAPCPACMCTAVYKTTRKLHVAALRSGVSVDDALRRSRSGVRVLDALRRSGGPAAAAAVGAYDAQLQQPAPPVVLAAQQQQQPSASGETDDREAADETGGDGEAKAADEPDGAAASAADDGADVRADDDEAGGDRVKADRDSAEASSKTIFGLNSENLGRLGNALGGIGNTLTNRLTSTINRGVGNGMGGLGNAGYGNGGYGQDAQNMDGYGQGDGYGLGADGYGQGADGYGQGAGYGQGDGYGQGAGYGQGGGFGQGGFGQVGGGFGQGNGDGFGRNGDGFGRNGDGFGRNGYGQNTGYGPHEQYQDPSTNPYGNDPPQIHVPGHGTNQEINDPTPLREGSQDPIIVPNYRHDVPKHHLSADGTTLAPTGYEDVGHMKNLNRTLIEELRKHDNNTIYDSPHPTIHDHTLHSSGKRAGGHEAHGHGHRESDDQIRVSRDHDHEHGAHHDHHHDHVAHHGHKQHGHGHHDHRAHHVRADTGRAYDEFGKYGHLLKGAATGPHVAQKLMNHVVAMAEYMHVCYDDAHPLNEYCKSMNVESLMLAEPLQTPTAIRE